MSSGASLAAGSAAVVAIGSHSSIVVPALGLLWMRNKPPDWAASPCTMDKPRPVPLPGAFGQRHLIHADAVVGNRDAQIVSGWERRIRCIRGLRVVDRRNHQCAAV